jgi:hypothetical protein
VNHWYTIVYSFLSNGCDAIFYEEINVLKIGRNQWFDAILMLFRKCIHCKYPKLSTLTFALKDTKVKVLTYL